jgi:hypothetical protein
MMECCLPVGRQGRKVNCSGSSIFPIFPFLDILFGIEEYLFFIELLMP